MSTRRADTIPYSFVSDIVASLNVQPSMMKVGVRRVGIHFEGYHADIHVEGERAADVARLIESGLRGQGIVFTLDGDDAAPGSVSCVDVALEDHQYLLRTKGLSQIVAATG